MGKQQSPSMVLRAKTRLVDVQTQALPVKPARETLPNAGILLPHRFITHNPLPGPPASSRPTAKQLLPLFFFFFFSPKIYISSTDFPTPACPLSQISSRRAIAQFAAIKNKRKEGKIIHEPVTDSLPLGKSRGDALFLENYLPVTLNPWWRWRGDPGGKQDWIWHKFPPCPEPRCSAARCQQDARDARSKPGKGEKSISRSLAASKTHQGDGKEGCRRCTTPSHPSFSQIQAGLWLTSVVRDPRGMILELLAMPGKNWLLCINLSPAQPRRARPPLPLPTPCSS